MLRPLLAVGLGLLAFGLGCTHAGWSQTPHPVFHVLSPNEGLASSYATAFAEDAFGYLWIGTEAGLHRYTLNRLEHFQAEFADSTHLADNFISALATAPDTSLWIGTQRGLHRLDTHAGTIQRFFVPQDGSLFFIRDLLVEGHETIWVLAEHALYQINLATLSTRPIALPASVEGKVMTAMAMDAQGSLWITTIDGLYRYDPWQETFDSKTSNNTPCGLPDSRLLDVYAEEAGLWIASWGGVSYRAAGSACFETFNTKNASLPHDIAIKLQVDSEGNLWVGTFKGLARFSSKNKQFISYLHTESANRFPLWCKALYLDRSGNLWVGTQRQGAIFFSTYRPFQHYIANEKGLPSSQIRHLLYLNQSVWIATDAGLARYHLATRRLRPVSLPYPTNADSPVVVEALHAVSEEGVWAATYHGLFLIAADGALLERYRNDPQDASSLAFNQVVAAHRTRDSTLWVAPMTSVIQRRRPRTDHFESLILPHTAPQDRYFVTDFFEDDQAVLWIATLHGLWRFNLATDRFVSLPSCPNQLRQRFPGDIELVRQDRVGRYWIGTRTHGLFLCDGLEALPRSYQVGVSGHFIKAIHENAEALFVLTDRALVRMEPHQNRFHPLYLGAMFQSYALETMTEDENGYLYIGGAQGLYIFHPDNLNLANYKAPIRLTNVFALDRSLRTGLLVDETHPPVLAYDENRLTFEYALLDYTNPSANRYEYRLDGFEEGWIAAEQKKSVTYASLPPGAYSFQVRGADASGFWGTQPASFSFIVGKPYWATAWFRVLVLLGLVLLATLAYRLRVRQLLHIERTRQRIADDLHDDIGSKMSSIALRAEMVGRSPELEQDQRASLTDISQAARELVTDLRDVVWIVDSGHDNLESLVARMRQVTGQLMPGRQYRFHQPEPVPSLSLTMDQRRNLFLIYKEMLHNAVRHASATRVDARIACTRHHLAITVTDDGVGFDPNTVQRGRGMQTLHMRAAQLGATLKIESELGQGTTMRLSVEIV